MKKIILLAFIGFILSGCTANYEITINGDKIEEKLTLIETNKAIFDSVTDTGWTIRESFESLLDKDEFGSEDYSVKSLTNDDQLGIEYTSKSASSILNSSIINQCYTNPTVNIDENIVTINTGSDFECYEFYDNLESVRVIFKTNHEVISANADEVENGSYIWNITKDGNKRIEISYDASVTKTNIIPYIVGAIVVITLLIVAYFVSKKVKTKNNI